MNDDNLKQEIKLDNKAIDKIKVENLNFSYVNKAGENKFKRLIKIPFIVPKKSTLKGLKLCIHKDTGSKYFWLSFWFNSKSDYYSIGKFTDVFRITEVEDKLLPIVRSHTNDKGHWVRNPNIIERENERIILIYIDII